MPITATAPGKLMLLGEHAVVYGHPCLVTAVDLRYQAELTPTEDHTVRIDTPQLTAPRVVSLAGAGAQSPEPTAFVEAVIARYRDQHGLNQGVTIHTNGPAISYGLGSSSAITVATAAALNVLTEAELNPHQLFRLCYDAVLDVQGAGSGYDVAAAIYGGTLYYRQYGADIQHLPQADLPLVIGYSGRKVGTVDLVERVRTLRDQFPQVIGPIFETVAGVVDAAWDALQADDHPRFGALMNINQGLTDALGVNTNVLSQLVYAAREGGALGAKLSGAGGGDCMFAWVTDDTRQPVTAALTKAEAEIVRLPVGAPGVVVG
jgi:mevalonate kinase